MATSSSSTRKAARLAQKGKGQRVRFQGGTLFPMVVAIVVVLGMLLVVYARQSRPAADASDPAVDDHWHAAYGFYLCDEWFQLSGNLEEADSSGFVNTGYARTGVHSHDDGVIHWHPFSSAATGSNATLGLFLDNYGVDISNSKLEFPEDQRPGLPYEQEDGVFENGETTCVIDGDEKDGTLQVVAWDNFSDTGSGTTYIADFGNIRINQDAMVFTIAFVPDNTDIEMPPWAPELPVLGQVDQGQLTPDDLFGGAGDDDSPAGPDAPASGDEPADDEEPAEPDSSQPVTSDNAEPDSSGDDDG